MQYRMWNIAAFAILVFLIPFLAMVSAQKEMQFLNKDHADIQETVQNEAAENTDEETFLQPSDDPEEGQEDLPEQVLLAQGVLDDGFEILDIQTGKLLSVTPQEYVRGALAAEMPPTFHPEALKAQAVAAHTYALHLKAIQETDPDPALEGADLSADPSNWKSFTTEELFRERYGSLADAYWQKICEAADAVEPYVMTYEGEPIVAAYHSMSSGTTEDASNVWIGGEPYLVPVDSFGDTLAPDYSTSQTVPLEEAREILVRTWPEAELGTDPSAWISVTERSEGGYVTEADVGGVEVAGTEIRSAFGLRSANFQVSCDGENLNFTVVGYGHGVGLSQYGADYMARQGADFEEILTHYYPGAQLAMVRKS